jgi:hypothetical protein
MLTQQQLATLKAAILADPVMAAKPMNGDGDWEIAALFNVAASPAFYVWKSSVQVSEIMANGFDWTRVDNLTIGKARIWEWMVAVGTINPAQTNVRTGVLAVFSVAGDTAMRLAIFGHCQRPATVFEKLFATGTGVVATEAGVGPATMLFEGMPSQQDVYDARHLA